MHNRTWKRILCRLVWRTAVTVTWEAGFKFLSLRHIDMVALVQPPCFCFQSPRLLLNCSIHRNSPTLCSVHLPFVSFAFFLTKNNHSLNMWQYNTGRGEAPTQLGRWDSAGPCAHLCWMGCYQSGSKLRSFYQRALVLDLFQEEFN